MKTPTQILILAGLTAIASASPADRPAQQRPIAAAIIAKFDADGDGVLNEAERKTARQSVGKRVREERLRRFDTNGDGTIDEAERKAARETMAERVREERLRRFDTNGDGTMDEAERKAARETMKRGGK
jgi:uncharacterized membrane protein YebE (DUF533 family)